MMTRVLVIDDERQILRALRINLSVRGYEVTTAATGAEALRAAADHRPDVVILDLGLPDMSGIEVLEGLRGCARRRRRRLRDQTVRHG
jgi:two-component system KDP operon response regulator KdpE